MKNIIKSALTRMKPLKYKIRSEAGELEKEIDKALLGLPSKDGMHKFMKIDGKKIRNKEAI